MEIKMMVSGVKGGTFEDDQKQNREYGYIYSVGEFRNSDRDSTFQTGLQMNKFRCPNLNVLRAVRQRLLAAKEPIEMLLDIEFGGKEGEISTPVVVGVK